jgi:hypothetical protein
MDGRLKSCSFSESFILNPLGTWTLGRRSLSLNLKFFQKLEKFISYTIKSSSLPDIAFRRQRVIHNQSIRQPNLGHKIRLLPFNLKSKSDTMFLFDIMHVFYRHSNKDWDEI